MIEIFKELNKFNKIKYYDEPHKYYLGDKQLCSVTTLLKKYYEEFDGEFWSDYKALQEICGDKFLEYKDEYRFPKDIVYNIKDRYYGDDFLKIKNNYLNKWLRENHLSTYKGSLVHNFIENYYVNKIFPIEYENKEKTLVFDDIKDQFKKCKQQFINFYNKTNHNLLSIRSELVVYDDEYEVAGMIDKLFFSLKFNSLCVFDWKTNKEIKRENRFNKMLSPIAHLDDCELVKYSLQLHIYRHILQKNTNLVLHKDCYIVWFNESNSDYELIKCYDLSDEAVLLLKNYKNEKNFI